MALKILPEAFASYPGRLARFQREAQALASLNHPNIAQIHGIEETEDTRALVLGGRAVSARDAGQGRALEPGSASSFFASHSDRFYWEQLDSLHGDGREHIAGSGPRSTADASGDSMRNATPFPRPGS